MNTTPAKRCRFMRKAILLTAFAALAATTLHAETVTKTVWAKGVTGAGGWQNTFQFRNGCWAAVSADMVAWWQKRVAEKYDTSSVKTWDSEELLRTYDTYSYFGDSGDYVWNALEWFFTNTVQSIRLVSPGYHYITGKKFAEVEGPKPIFYTMTCYDQIQSQVEAALQEFVDANGNCIASVRNSSHAYTLYGVEYTEEESGKKTFTALYVTDPTPVDYTDSTSPYNVPTMHRVTLYYNPNWEGLPRIFGWYYITLDKDGAVSSSRCPLDPVDFTFLRIDDEVIVNKNGETAFALKDGGTGGETQDEGGIVRPEVETIFTTEETAKKRAEAINADKKKFIEPPFTLDDTAKSTYSSLFSAKVLTKTDGTFAVTAQLTDEGKAKIQKSVNDLSAVHFTTLATGDATSTIKTVPGLYYSVFAGANPQALERKSTTQATSSTTDITFPSLGTSGFYRLKATLAQP